MRVYQVIRSFTASGISRRLNTEYRVYEFEQKPEVALVKRRSRDADYYTDVDISGWMPNLLFLRELPEYSYINEIQEDLKYWGAKVQTLVNLAAIACATLIDGQQRLVEDEGANYRYDASSTAAPSGATIIRPDCKAAAAPGRWIISGGGGGAAAHFFDISFTFQNQGTVLNTGVQDSAYVEIGDALTIEAVFVFGAKLDDGPGSIVVDLWVASKSLYPPGPGDSICGGTEPELVVANRSEDTDLTGWTTELAQGVGILPNIDSVSDLVWAKVVLRCRQL